MALVIQTETFVWGIQDPLPLKGFPEGKTRLRLRSNELGCAYVKTPDGIREFAIKVEGGFWVPAFERGSNITASRDGS